MHMHTGDEDGYKSRSQKKRESTADQRLGERLAALAPPQLAGLGLAPDLENAFTDLARMKSHEARRRQMQYIGRLMREEETGRILAALEETLLPSREETAALHRVEQAREKLVAAASRGEMESELAALAALHPALDTSRLRHLAESAVAERAKGKPPKAFRELFKILKTILRE